MHRGVSPALRPRFACLLLCQRRSLLVDVARRFCRFCLQLRFFRAYGAGDRGGVSERVREEIENRGQRLHSSLKLRRVCRLPARATPVLAEATAGESENSRLLASAQLA